MSNNTIKMNAALLADEAAWIGRGKGGYVAILNTTQVTTTASGLRLRRTDYDLFRESTVLSDDSYDGDSTVQIDAAKLAALLKGSKGDAVVTVENTGLTVVIGGSRTVKLPSAADAEDFPEWPQFEATDDPAVLDPATLARGLTSAGNDDTLPMLTGVRFEGGAMITTDRFRLSRITFDTDGFTALVPGSALRPFTVGKDVVTVEHGKLATMENPDANQMRVRVSAGGRSVTAAVLDCEFPKWRHLIPADDALPVAALIRRADLLDAIGAGERVKLELRGDDTMLVSTVDRDGDAAVEQTIAATIIFGGDQLPLTVQASVKNLTGCLKGTAAGAVTFAASTPTKPIVLKGAGDGDFHLIMPVRMPS